MTHFKTKGKQKAPSL